MRDGSYVSFHVRRSVRRAFIVLAVGVALVTALPAAGAQPTAASDPAVITAWNATAASTIAGAPPNGAGKNNAEGVAWFSYVQAAVYNAVVGITGKYELYRWHAQAPHGASPQA